MRGVSNKHCLLPFFIANSADPDEMLHYVAFLQGLYCSPKYLFACIRNEKGYSLQFVIGVFPDHTLLLFLMNLKVFATV